MRSPASDHGNVIFSSALSAALLALTAALAYGTRHEAVRFFWIPMGAGIFTAIALNKPILTLRTGVPFTVTILVMFLGHIPSRAVAFMGFLICRHIGQTSPGLI